MGDGSVSGPGRLRSSGIMTSAAAFGFCCADASGADGIEVAESAGPGGMTNAAPGSGSVNGRWFWVAAVALLIGGWATALFDGAVDGCEGGTGELARGGTFAAADELAGESPVSELSGGDCCRRVRGDPGPDLGTTFAPIGSIHSGGGAAPLSATMQTPKQTTASIKRRHRCRPFAASSVVSNGGLI